MTEINTQFADRLDIACNDAGLPIRGRQTVLAKKLQISQPAVAKWFCGKSVPTIDKVVDLSKLLKVEIEWLVTGRGPKELQTDLSSDLISRTSQAMSKMSKENQKLVVDFAEMIANRSI